MYPAFLVLAVGLATLGASTSRAADDLVIADFEGADYGNWSATGTAFGSGPARGTLPGQMSVDGFQGRGLVNSFHGGDGSTGTLTSPEFKIERRYLRFLIGGGKNLERTCLVLRVAGAPVRRATGPNDQPGGSEALSADSWEVAEFLGKNAVLQVIDDATGGWGHVNVDHIVQSDQKPPGWIDDASRDFRISARYLNLPIRNGAPKRRVTTLVDGLPVVKNDVELADRRVDWWAPMEVGAWRGRKVTLQVDRLPEDSQALAMVEPSDGLRDASDLYREPLRGQFHFSPRRGWNNDPNGLSYFRGEYHLFFQHNPYGWNWGNMHWGHAVSTDLIHWKELGDPLAPDPLGPMFSGSAVVDSENTSGLGKPGQPAHVLLYTAAGDPTVQCLAWSTDGRTYTKLPENPVLKQFTPGNRDPKVLWHAPSRKWVMTLYVETNQVHSIFFLGSPNLKDWTYLSRTDGFFECPDFFELPLDRHPDQRKWVLTAASSEYQVGTFDGVRFTPETPKLPGHRGRNVYAAQTFSDLPTSDGRRLQMGWFQTATPGMPFNQSMTVPLELNLIGTTDGPRLTWQPARELRQLRRQSRVFPVGTLAAGSADPLKEVAGELVELHLEFEPIGDAELTLDVRGAKLRYQARTQEWVINDDHRAPAPLRNGIQDVTVLCDRMGLEVFASGGLTYLPMAFLPKPENRSLSLQVRGQPAILRALDVHQLESAWE